MANLGDLDILRHHFTKALEHLFQSREQYRALGDLSDAGRTELRIGHVLRMNLQDIPSAMAYYRKSLETARQAKDVFEIARSLTFMGNLYLEIGELRQASDHLVKALPIAESLPGEDGALTECMVYMELAKLRMELKDPGQAEAQLLKARTCAARLKNRRDLTLSRVETIQGHLLRQEGRFDEALTTYDHAQSLRQGTDSPDRDAANFLYYRAETERMAGRLSAAREHYGQALERWRALQDVKAICEATLGLGQIQLVEKNPRGAIGSLEEARRLAETNGLLPVLRDILSVLSDAYAETGNTAKALEYRRQYETWKERVQGIEVAADVSRLLERYEKTRLDRELHLQKRRSQWVMASSIGLSGILAIIVLALLRQRRKPLEPAALQIEPDPAPAKTIKPVLTEAQVRQYLTKLKTLMERERLYLDPELSMDTLARRLRINSKYLSQLLNTHLGKSFTDYLNELRFETAKGILSDPAQAHQQIQEVGQNAGFQSKSTFFRVFRQQAGMTPSEFRERLRDNEGAGAEP